MSGPGRLVLAATPIGDVQDASPRLMRLLAEADVVAAEDTRRVRRLCQALGVVPAGRVVSHHEHNEVAGATDLIADVAAGRTVLLVTDAGTPGVSDPGYRLVEAAVAAGVPVTAVPGPSAVLVALAVSGLPTDRFCFEGFLPRRAGERARTLAALTGERRTMVFFEAPHRIASTLAAMSEAFGGDRAAVVCRELTKTYEEIRRASLVDLTAWASGQQVLGEVTLVVAGAAPWAPPASDVVPDVLDLVEEGVRLKDAVARVSERHGVPKRELYDAAVAARAR